MKRDVTKIKASSPCVTSQPPQVDRSLIVSLGNEETRRKERVKISTADLLSLELLSQINECFLVAKLKRMILALDQHAMHERINLEQLERAYKANTWHIEENLSIFTSFAATTVPLATARQDWGDIKIDVKTYQVLRECEEYLLVHGVTYKLSH
jgi:DNA mismatch repair ATPase MutL